MNDPVLASVADLVASIEDDLDEPRCVVYRAVVVAAFIDGDGNRRLRIIRDGEVTTWEARGMLTTVLSDLAAFDVVDVLEEED